MIYTLDLTTARAGEPLDLGGTVYRLEVVTADSDFRLSVEGPGGPAFPLRLGNVVLVPGGVDQVWITNAAAFGEAELHANPDVCLELGGGGGGGDLEGLYEAAPTAVPDGSTKALLIDENGRLIVRLGDALTPTEDTVGVASAAPGTEGNAWDGAAVGAGGDSAGIDVSGGGVVSIFGTVDGATNLDVWYSQDGATYYKSGRQISLAGAGDFGEDFRIGAAFVRLRSSAAVTATVTVANKP